MSQTNQMPRVLPPVYKIAAGNGFTFSDQVRDDIVDSLSNWVEYERSLQEQESMLVSNYQDDLVRILNTYPEDALKIPGFDLLLLDIAEYNIRADDTRKMPLTKDLLKLIAQAYSQQEIVYFTDKQLIELCKGKENALFSFIPLFDEKTSAASIARIVELFLDKSYYGEWREKIFKYLPNPELQSMFIDYFHIMKPLSISNSFQRLIKHIRDFENQKKVIELMLQEESVEGPAATLAGLIGQFSDQSARNLIVDVLLEKSYYNKLVKVFKHIETPEYSKKIIDALKEHKIEDLFSLIPSIESKAIQEYIIDCFAQQDYQSSMLTEAILKNPDPSHMIERILISTIYDANMACVLVGIYAKIPSDKIPDIFERVEERVEWYAERVNPEMSDKSFQSVCELAVEAIEYRNSGYVGITTPATKGSDSPVITL